MAQRHTNIVKLLLKTYDVEVDQNDRQEKTPLLWASLLGHQHIFVILVRTGNVRVDFMNPDGWTPLLWAAGNGHSGIFDILLEFGASLHPNERVFG